MLRSLSPTRSLRKNRRIETRDSEIDRLSSMLEGGRPYDVVALETRNRSNERLISHLNIQIDYLQNKNAELQRVSDTAMSRARLANESTIDLDSRNIHLAAELRDVDRMARELQLDKDTTIKVADMELTDAKIELEKARGQLENMDLEVAQLRAEKENLSSENVELKGGLNSELADRQRLEELLDKVQADKKKLGNRINKMTSNEKEMVMEIDRLKYNKNGLKKKTPNRIEQFLKAVEEERDYWKTECDTLSKLLKTKSSPRSRPSSPTRSLSRSSSPTRSLSRSQTSTPSKKPKSRSSSPSPGTKSGSKNKTVANLEAVVKVLEDERDHFKRECDLLKAMRTRPTSPSRLSTRDQNVDDTVELLRVQRERDELQNLLDKFERHMAEIQANVKVLTGERDKLNSLYEETKDELNRLRRDVVRSPKSPKTSLAAQAVLRRVENERDDTAAELRRMTTERDSLRERLKIATETQLADRARLEQRLEDLESNLGAVEQERNEAVARGDALQRLASSLEQQIKNTAVALSDTKDEASAQKSAAAQMRLLAEQAEKSLEEAQMRLTRKEADMRASSERNLSLEDQIVNANTDIARLRDELARQKISVTSLDREKDGLQMTVDEKAEKIVRLQEEIRLRERHGEETSLKIRELELNIDQLNSNIASQDREISSQRRQLDSLNEELVETGRAKEAALRENRRLQDDLATMTVEHQKVSRDLIDACEEKQSLADQVQDYVMEVKRTEELLSSKENERGELLEQYRALTMEAEQFQTHSHQLESEGSNMRLELMTRDSDNRRLRERCDQMEREVGQHLHTERNYEKQVLQLTKSVGQLEECLRNVEEEKHGVLQDLSAVRDLCTRLEAAKDALQRQLTAKTLDIEKAQSLIDDMRHDHDVLRSQLTSERTTSKSLEGLLQSNREKDFHVEIATQERDSEIQLLKDRLSLNESKLDTQTRELGVLRTRNIELESEMDRVRRSLTNERFERERAVQELRRNGITPPGEASVRLSRRSSPSRSPTRARSPGRSRSPYRSAVEDDPLMSTHTV